jgi:hypothetical protein
MGPEASPRCSSSLPLNYTLSHRILSAPYFSQIHFNNTLPLNLMYTSRYLDRPKESVGICVTFRKMLLFTVGSCLPSALLPTWRTTAYRLSATVLFSILAATLHVWRPPSATPGRAKPSWQRVQEKLCLQTLLLSSVLSHEGVSYSTTAVKQIHIIKHSALSSEFN